MPKLSIITICLNEKANIEKTLSSVAQQTFSNFEWHILDGGSKDGSVDIIEEYRIKYKNKITTFICQKDNGIYNAYNKGIQLSKGEYILFLNGGDYLYNEHVLKTVFDQPMSAEILIGQIKKTKRGIFIKQSKPKTYRATKYYLFCHGLPTPASFIKRSLFLQHGLYDETFKITADRDFFVKEIAKYKTKVNFLPQTITVFNTEGISCREESRAIKENEHRIIRKRHYSFFHHIFFSFLLFLRKLRVTN